MTNSFTHTEEVPRKSRLWWGAAIFLTGQLSPLLVPFIVGSDLSTPWKTGLSGLFLLGIPELAIVVAIGVLGKAGFNYLKLKVFGFFRRYAPPARVSARRYRIGLILFVLPLVAGWLLPYVAHLLPFYQEYRFVVNVSGDVMFISSVFVLGGDFWDKVRALFIQNSRVEFP